MRALAEAGHPNNARKAFEEKSIGGVPSKAGHGGTHTSKTAVLQASILGLRKFITLVTCLAISIVNEFARITFRSLRPPTGLSKRF